MSADDYCKIVNFQGDVVYDSKTKQDRMRARDGEPFTATTDCPKCGTMAVHYLTEPRLEPCGDEPAAKAQRRMSRHATLLGFDGWSFDPPGTVVARVCVKCEYRWGQS